MKSLAILLCTTLLIQAHNTLDLKISHQTAPPGIDDATPRLSWRMEGDKPGLAQTSCQILVATSEARLAPGQADLWDSGRIETSSTHTTYAGKPLPSARLLQHLRHYLLSIRC